MSKSITGAAISIDTSSIKSLVDQAVEDNILSSVTALTTNRKIENIVNQAVVSRTLQQFESIDINAIIHQHVDEHMAKIKQDLLTATAVSIDTNIIRGIVDKTIEDNIQSTINKLATDSTWLEKIEKLANQAVVRHTLQTIGSIDIGTIIHRCVDDNMAKIRLDLLTNFASTGIDDKATACQLTIMDDATVVENTLTARDGNFVESVTVKDLSVTGSINSDSRCWLPLANTISAKTLAKLNEDWREKLVAQVSEKIRTDGIAFDTVKVGEYPLVSDAGLARSITQSNLQKVGRLQELTVDGETHLNETVVVVKKRLGVNTEQPDAALNVWDEEVSVSMGKYKHQEAYIGTNRNQALNIGIGRTPQITLGADGITSINKLRVAQYAIGHGTMVPGYSGTKGDIVFNVDPLPGSAFAWVCLGGHNWKVLKAAE